MLNVLTFGWNFPIYFCVSWARVTFLRECSRMFTSNLRSRVAVRKNVDTRLSISRSWSVSVSHWKRGLVSKFTFLRQLEAPWPLLSQVLLLAVAFLLFRGVEPALLVSARSPSRLKITYVDLCWHVLRSMIVHFFTLISNHTINFELDSFF